MENTASIIRPPQPPQLPQFDPQPGGMGQPDPRNQRLAFLEAAEIARVDLERFRQRGRAASPELQAMQEEDHLRQLGYPNPKMFIQEITKNPGRRMGQNEQEAIKRSEARINYANNNPDWSEEDRKVLQRQERQRQLGFKTLGGPPSKSTPKMQFDKEVVWEKNRAVPGGWVAWYKGKSGWNSEAFNPEEDQVQVNEMMTEDAWKQAQIKMDMKFVEDTSARSQAWLTAINDRMGALNKYNELALESGLDPRPVDFDLIKRDTSAMFPPIDPANYKLKPLPQKPTGPGGPMPGGPQAGPPRGPMGPGGPPGGPPPGGPPMQGPPQAPQAPPMQGPPPAPPMQTSSPILPQGHPAASDTEPLEGSAAERFARYRRELDETMRQGHTGKSNGKRPKGEMTRLDLKNPDEAKQFLLNIRKKYGDDVPEMILPEFREAYNTLKRNR